MIPINLQTLSAFDTKNGNATTSLNISNVYIWDISFRSTNNASKPEITCDGRHIAKQLSSGDTYTQPMRYYCGGTVFFKKYDNNDVFFRVSYATTTFDWGINTTSVSPTSSNLSPDGIVSAIFFSLLLVFAGLYWWKDRFTITRYD